MFRILGNISDIYGLKIGKNGREIVKVPDYYVDVMYDNKYQILTDVIRRNVCLYDGIIQEIGPDIKIDGYQKYVNKFHIDKKNLNDIEFFVNGLKSGNISGIVPDTAYTLENLYDIYVNLISSVGLEPRTKQKFSNDIQEFILDTSYRSIVDKTIISTMFKPGMIVKASTKKGNRIRYYLYRENTPVDLNRPTLI